MKKSLPELAEEVSAEYALLRNNTKRVKTNHDWSLACNTVYQKYDGQTDYINELAFRTAIGQYRSSLLSRSKAAVADMKAAAEKVIDVLKPRQQVEQMDLFQSDARRGGFSTT